MILSVQSFLQARLSRHVSAADLTDEWNSFYSAYDRIIRRFAMACGMQDCDVDECAQEVWVAVVNGLHTFEQNSTRARFRSWLYGIVRNKAADLVRVRMKHSAVSLNDSGATFDLEDTMPPPTHAIEAAWRSEILREALSTLQKKASRRDFSVFVDRSVRSKAASIVAVENQMTEGAVRVVDHRLRKQLQEIIHQMTDGQMVASFS